MNFLDLETELTAFVRSRSPTYLQEKLSAGCYVYGAGGYGRRILALLRARGVYCHGIIDRKFTGAGEIFEGLPAFAPEALPPAQVKGKCLVVGVHSHLAKLDTILAYGRSLPFGDVLWNADLPDALGAEADNFWLTARRFVIEHLSDFAETTSRLADDVSVRTLMELTRYRITGEPEQHPDFNLSEQYFPSGVLRLPKQISFVDGGAFDGDTFRYLRGKGVEIGDWAAFEPDPRNFGRLVDFAREVSSRPALFPCGLGDEFSQIRFASDGGTSSRIAASGDITIPSVALDDVLPKLNPDYIKLDIEGAEAAALRGMARAIGRARPHFAVSVYHRPDDLWTLPRLLRELAPYAKLYLRQHEANAFDTVLYGVPA